MKHYLNFVKIKSAIKFDCDQNCEKILEFIAIQEQDETPLTVTKLMHSGMMSSASLHRKMYMLEEARYISLTYKKPNHRTKYLLLTDKAKSYFKTIQSAMK